MAKNKNIRLKMLLAASYTNNLGWGIYSPLYAVYVLKLGGSTFDISLLWSAYALVTGLLMMVFGRLENSKKYNPSFMLAIGYGLFVAVAVGFMVINSIQQYYVLQILLAVAMGIMTPAAKYTYSRAEKKGNEAGQWGLFDGGNYILMAVAAFSGGLLYKAYGFDGIFGAMLIIQTIATYLAISHYKATKTSAR